MSDTLFASARITRAATRAELQALESAIGQVPPSFWSFAETYGDGLTNGLILVFMPFNAQAGEFLVESRGLRAMLNEFVSEWVADGGSPGEPDCLEPYDERSRGIAARYKELVFYARSENGESFAWLREENDYSFYSLDGEFLSLRYCGNSLLKMIGDLQTMRVKQLMGTGYGPLASSFVGFGDPG